MKIEDLDYLEYGQVLDMMVEMSNDDYDYPYMATQEDMDRL